MRPVFITVEHTPAPQGSKRHVGNGRMVESSARVKPYRQAVQDAAAEAMSEHPGPFPLLGPVVVRAVYIFDRPASHYGTGRNARIVKASAPSAPDTRSSGDIDKLTRSTLDALSTGSGAGLIRDDSQVVRLEANKRWADRGMRPGAALTVFALNGDPA